MRQRAGGARPVSAAPRFRVTCEDCPGYALEPRISHETADWEAEFHDDLVHQDGEEHAVVEEVDVE